MANETRGILVEVLVFRALEKAAVNLSNSWRVRWNDKPERMSINPDFTIGIDVNDPRYLILVTASGAEHNSHMKMWRNLAEIFEGKAQLPTTPSLISIYGLSRQKKIVRSIINDLVDAGFHSDEQPYSKHLNSWIDKNINVKAKTKEVKLAILDADIQKNPQLAGAISALAQDLAQALQQRNTELDPLWALMREDYAKPHNSPPAKTTSVRRGLGKLLVLEPQIRQLVYAGYNKRSGIRSDNLPEYAFKLGFFKKSLVDAQVADPEIKGVLDLLGSETCEAVLKQAPGTVN